ncbi:MAG: SMC-Scp complex subunit ScpB [Mycobacteriales bacterium]
MDPGESGTRGAVEAVLFVADEPLTSEALALAVRATPDDVEAVLRHLSAEYTESVRGFDLRQVAGGWRIYTREQFADVVERHVQEGQQARLTQAALETLSIVAYRQPITRARVAAIRGVSVDGVFRSLVARGLIEECGSGGPGGAFLYQTTDRFLEQLGLDSLSQLPSLAPLLPDTSEVQDDSSSI